MRELGDNYESYHAFLANRLADLGGRPNPKDYASYDDYAEAMTAAEDVVRAEIALRACRGFRRWRKPLDSLPSTPLLDEADRLLPDRS